MSDLVLAALSCHVGALAKTEAQAKAGSGGRRGDREVSMRDETVFRVTNSRYHANPSSDRVSFRRRCDDLMFQTNHDSEAKCSSNHSP